MSKKLMFYLVRWQLSGFVMLIPIYALIASGITDPTVNMIVASFIGGLIFYNIDKIIFKKGGCKCQHAHTVEKKC